MTDSKDPAGPQGDYYPPPPPGPPPGHNGLDLHPNEQPIPDSHSELYDNTSHTTGDEQQQQQQQQHAQTQPPVQQTAHQPLPPDSDGAPKKANWAQRFSSFGTKAAAPFNMLANKLGAENFLPSTMDKECEKAARILRNFCSKRRPSRHHHIHPTIGSYQGHKLTFPLPEDGIYTDAQAPETVEAPTVDADGKPTTAPAKPKKNRTLLTIPSSVINKAVGLAIFTTARAGFHVSGATGSGVIIARLPDGSWSPPSGIQVHSVGAGFMIGIDIYDCIVVINTREALEAFTKTRMSLGSDLAVVAGPWGAGGSVDFAAPQGKYKGKDGAAVAAEGTETTKEAEDKAAEGTSPVGDDKVYETPATTTTTTTTTVEPTPDPPRRLGEYSSWGGSKKKTTPTTSTPARPDGTERKPSALKQAIKQPTYSYVKSRGFYAGVQVDGTIVTERKDANAAFYGEPVAVQQILKGEVPLVPGKERWAELVKPLFDTIKGAEGWHAQSSSPDGGNNNGQWANQMGPDPNSTYGAAYDPVFDKHNENPPPKPPRPTSGAGGVTEGVASMNLNGGSFPATSGGVAVAAAASSSSPSGAAATTEIETPSARAKAAEAAAEAEMNREREERERRELAGVADPRASMATAPPGYTEMSGGAGEGLEHTAAAEDMPPAYVDDGAAATTTTSAARPDVSDTKSPAGPGA